jgi:ribosome-binding protein aMBF1 (putative translation factor)
MQQKNEHFCSNSFAAALAHAIAESGQSKRAFAASLGIAHTSINRYLTGATPALDEAIKLARHLGITLDELVYGSNSVAIMSDGVWRERAMAAEQRLAAVKAGMTELLKKI